MGNNEVKYVPFTNTEELRFHMDASKMLIDSIKEMIDLREKQKEDGREEMENYIIQSLHVLMDGLASVILSIEQGYVK